MLLETKNLLISLAEKYETEDFIHSDPISFPHRYRKKEDVEIAAMIASWLAYGKRELFLRVLDDLSKDFNDSPFGFIRQQKYKKYQYDNTCLYRFYKKKDYYLLCQRLYNIYFGDEQETNMQMKLSKLLNTNKTDDCILVLQKLIYLFDSVVGIPQNTLSACKRLCMFLRWMVRKDSPVDFGIWDIIDAQNLIIPVDVHVFRQSSLLRLTSRHSVDMKTAIEITEHLKEVFPNDPLKADFALFGYGVNNQKN